MRNKANLVIAILVLFVAGIFSSDGFGWTSKRILVKEPVNKVLIKNVNIFDGNTRRLMTDQSVLVEGDKIAAVGKGLRAKGRVIVIDGGGGTLTPGLIDMHQHILPVGPAGAQSNDNDAYAQGARGYAQMYDELFMQGITTIRDIGGNTLGMARAVKQGLLQGPRIYSSGPALSTTGGYGDCRANNDMTDTDGFRQMACDTVIADGVTEVLKAARKNFRDGASFLKVIQGGPLSSVFDTQKLPGFTLEELQAVVAVADNYNSYVTVQAWHDTSYNRALDAGVKCFEYGFFITEPTVKRMVKDNAVYCFQPYGGYTIFAGDYPEWFSEDMRTKAQAVQQATTRVAQLMKKNGVFMVIGSSIFGSDANRVIDNFIAPISIPDAGFTSYDCMKMATGNAGKVLSMSGPETDYYKEAPLGVIKEGARADMLIYDGNPVKDIEVIGEEDNLKMIMKDGKIYKNTFE